MQEGYSGGRGAGGDRVPMYMKIAILAEAHAMLNLDSRARIIG
jgi:hypothetical protein